MARSSRVCTGSPVPTTVPRPADSSTCIGGSILGSADEFYFPPQPGDDRAIIEIKVFATPDRRNHA